jgi:hypothetical protein
MSEELGPSFHLENKFIKYNAGFSSLMNESELM